MGERNEIGAGLQRLALPPDATVSAVSRLERRAWAQGGGPAREPASAQVASQRLVASGPARTQL